MEGAAGAATAAAATGGEMSTATETGASLQASAGMEAGIDPAGVIEAEIPEGEGLEPGEEAPTGPYDLSILEGLVDPEALDSMEEKLNEFKDMGFTQEQMNFLALELALAHVEGQMADAEPPQIQKAELSTEERKAWKNIANGLVSSFPEDHETIRKVMNDTSVYKLIFKMQAPLMPESEEEMAKLKQGGKDKISGKMAEIRGMQETIQPAQTENPFYGYTDELKQHIGKDDKVREVKEKWLKNYPQLADKIKI